MSSSPFSPYPVHTSSTPSLAHITVLDGIRGLAAIYVFLSHAYQQSPTLMALPWLRWLSCGHYAVDVFIVLSGYCLMIAPARSNTGYLSTPFWPYLQRRARRLLPAYYCAYLLALLSTGFAQLRRIFDVLPSSSTAISEANPFTLDNIGAHLLLIHNLDIEWIRAVNGGLWTVATEWQIYLLFPLILLPLWKRYGNVITICLMGSIGVLLAMLIPEVAYACPWYMGLFAIGMGAATLCFSPNPAYRPYYQWFAQRRVSIALTSIFLLIGVSYPIPPDLGAIQVPYGWAVDFLVGLISAALLLHLHATEWEHNRLARFIFVPWIRNIGIFSYSLYLIHGPLLYKVDGLLKVLHLTPIGLDISRFMIGVPSILGAAYLFYWVFERPWLTSRPKLVPAHS